ncbi:MAG: hypothetical protein Q9185_005711 [Variospora sp. 1 TL-2023]
MLPLGLLNAAQGHPMLVELKNGETLNGHLVNCDTWMNLTLKESKSSNRINLLAEAEAVVYNEVEATGDEGLLGVEEDAAGVEVEEVEARQPLGQQMLLEKREGDTCEDKKIHPQRYRLLGNEIPLDLRQGERNILLSLTAKKGASS